jgi:hypothetical protein
MNIKKVNVEKMWINKKKKWNHAHTYTWYVNEKNEMHNKCTIKDVMECNDLKN